MSNKIKFNQTNSEFGAYDKVTLEQPGVNAPGTAKSMTVLPLHNSDKLTLLAGVFSYKSTLGTESPTCRNRIQWLQTVLRI